MAILYYDEKKLFQLNTENTTYVIGLSPEASSLVAKMEGSKLWKSPALSGALQPDPRSRRDRFSLTAELVGSAPAAPSPTGAANGAGKH